MRFVWLVITALVLGTTLAFTVRLPVHAREANRWQLVCNEMSSRFGESWYDKLASPATTSPAEWHQLRDTYVALVQRL